jgi:hypothetical protein
MENIESAVEHWAGLDMVPLVESFEWSPAPDDDASILRHDFHLKVSEQVAIPAGAEL